jgi:hypothetical protein
MAPAILSRIRSAERTAWLFAAACAVGASAIIIAMPMYHDHAIYWRGGERLLLGRPLADDYLVKQPGIYATFAFSRAIFGEHEWSYRVVDAALQLFCAALLALVAFRSGGHLLAAAVCVLYLVTYSGSAFVLGSHPESYVGIPLALLVLLRTSSQQRRWHAVAEGMLYVLLVMLKLTFGIVALGMLGWDLARRHAPRTVVARHWFGVASGALIACAIFFAVFYHTIAWDTVPDTVEYLRFYASTPPMSIAALLHAWHATLRVATENVTIFNVAMAAWGWIAISSDSRDERVHLVAFLTLLIAASIIIERKFGIVHLWRILPMLALFAAIGALHFASTLWNYWKSSTWALRAGVLVPLLLAAFALVRCRALCTRCVSRCKQQRIPLRTRCHLNSQPTTCCTAQRSGKSLATSILIAHRASACLCFRHAWRSSRSFSASRSGTIFRRRCRSSVRASPVGGEATSSRTSTEPIG